MLLPLGQPSKSQLLLPLVPLLLTTLLLPEPLLLLLLTSQMATLGLTQRLRMLGPGVSGLGPGVLGLPGLDV